MNARCFKTVFSEHLGCLVAVGEHACSQGKSSGESPAGKVVGAAGSAAAVFIGALVLSMAWVSLAWAQTSGALAVNALPKAGQVVQGAASMVQSSSPTASQLTINQTSQRAAINWQSFDIGAAAKVQVVQPNAQAVLLNRVVGQSPSQIFGQLQANGHVILVNPNGVLFGKDGSVNAGSFTASTMGITDADFMAGNMVYQRNGSTAGVVNQGTIQVAPGGYVVLLGASVSNEGKIIAPQGGVESKGGVALGSAETIKVPVSGSGRIKLELTAADINAKVSNTGQIVSEGGQVYMQALALNRAAAQVIQSGSIDTSGQQGGAVHLLADGGTIKVDGSITANSSGTDDKGQQRKGGDIVIGRDVETGVLAKVADVSGAKLESNKGFVETSGDVLFTTGTRVKAGEWLLDPYNITIAAGAATGTDYSNYTSGADSTILASDISANLTAGTSVTLATGAGGNGAGNIDVNESIAKTGGGDATLTLLAHGGINVAAGKTITSDTGKLNVVFNSDADGTNGGGITFNTGSGITSNGGNITLGGGTALNGSGFASGDAASTLQGINLQSAAFAAGGGNIVMNGQSPASSASNASNIAGILMTSATLSTSGAGTIAITGNNRIGNSTTGNGLVMNGGTITGGSTGAVTLVGDSSAAQTGFSFVKGAVINGTVTSAGGNINITGTGGQGAQAQNGVDIGGSVTAVGTGQITITGTAGNGSVGDNVGVSVTSTAQISSVDGDISISGLGGIGNGAVIRNHGVVVSSTNAIRATGSGGVTVTGRAINNDTVYSQGVVIGGAGLRTNSGNIKVDGQALNNYQVAVNISAAVTATTGNVYIRSVNAGISNSSAGVISGNNVSIENTGGSIDANGVITPGAGGATTWAGQVARNGIDLSGSVTAANNLNIYGNQTNTEVGVRMSGATTTIAGKNVTLYGKSSTGNGVLLAGATLSGAYLNATGLSSTGKTGFAWQGGNINTTGTTGTSTASVVKGMSGSTTTADGYGAWMMFANGAANASSGTTLTLAGEATALATGQNIKERGILVQGGYVLNMTGDVTLDGSSKSSEGIAFGGTINMGTVAGVTNKLTIKGTAAASSNSSLNALNLSGTINSNASTSSINIIGDAKNLSGTSWDNAVNISGAITGGTSSVNIQSTGATITTSAAISGANISVDNTNGTIDSSTGVITTGIKTSGSALGVSIGGNVTATGNLNLFAASAGNIGLTVVGSKNLSAANIQATGKTASGAYGVVLNGSNAITTTGTSGDSLIKGMTTGGGTNALLAWGGLNLTAATSTSLTLWGAGTSTGDRAARFDGGVTTNGAVTLKGTSSNATSLMLINGLATANANSALTLSGTTNGSGQSAVYFVNNGGVSLRNGATLNITGQNTNASGTGTGVLIQGAGIARASGATSAGAVSITGSTSSTAAGSTGVAVQAGVSTDGNIDVQGNVVSAASTGVSITSSGGVISSGSTATINVGSNYGITNDGYIKVSGSTGTGSNINLTSTNNVISGAGTVGDTTNKNASVTFTQSGTSTYSGAINAANFTKAGAGSLTLDSWARATPVATNISNAYTVKGGGALSLSTTLASTTDYAQLNPASVNVENESTFSLTGSSYGVWKNTAFNFTGGNGGGTMNLGGNPIGDIGTTNTFSTSGGATNTLSGLFNANGANANLNLMAATSGTSLLDGSFAAIALTQSTQGGYGLQGAATVNMSGGGHLLLKDKVSATTFNINAGNVQVGDGSAATAAATATLDAANISIAAGSKLTFNRAEAYTNASAIAGTGSLIQAGAGTVTLTGNSSAFAGATTVNAGKTLAIGTGGSLGAAGSTVTLADAASRLQFTGATGVSVVGSTITGAGGVSQMGAGTTLLLADNNYLGTSTVSGGTLQVGNGGVTGTLGAADVTLSNNANLSYVLAEATTIANNISGAGNVSAVITGASSDLTVDHTINLTNGTVNLVTDGHLSVTQAISTTNTTSSAVFLEAGKALAAGNATGGNVTISGSGAVTAGTGARITYMTGSVAGSTGLGVVAGQSRYNSDETTTNYAAALGSGAYAVYREKPEITVQVDSVSKTYDGNAFTGGSLSTTLVSGALVNGDTFAAVTANATAGGAAQGAKNASATPYAIAFSDTGGVTNNLNALGYGVTYISGTLTVNQKEVSLAAAKTYDGNKTLSGSQLTITTGVGSETLNYSSATIHSKNVGDNSTNYVDAVTLENGSNGELSSNYKTPSLTVAAVGKNTVVISKKDLALAATAADKVYDASTAATVTLSSDMLSGDSLTLGKTGATFADKHVGASKTVTVSGLSIGGLDAGNYNLTNTSTTTTASITPKDLVISATATDKVYDTTTGATVSLSSDMFSGDNLTLGKTGASFADKHAGSGKTVTVSGLSIAGADVGNYTLTNTSATTTATISQAPLTVTATHASKEYDGLYTATGTGVVGALAGAEDSVNTLGAQVFVDKNAGAANKIVRASGVTIKDSLGLDVTSNYSFNYVDHTTSTITPAPLTIKVNDTAMFVTQDARTALDQGFSYSAFKNGETAATALNGGALTAADRAYLGASNFPVVGSYERVYGLTAAPTSVNGNYAITVEKGHLTVAPADKLLITIASQNDTFGNRTSGNSGLASSGSVSAQYCLNALNCNGVNLVDLAMTQLAGNQWKATDATGSYVVFETAVQSSQFSTGGYLKVGNYLYGTSDIAPVSMANGNFSGRATNGGVLTIDPLAVSLSSGSIRKTYDGNDRIAGIALTPTNAALGDVVTASASNGSFATKNAGTGISVSLSNLSLSGTDAANYYLPTNTINSTGVIDAKQLSLVASVADKVYDGSVSAPVNSFSVSGLVVGDHVAYSTPSGSFADKNVARNVAGQVVSQSATVALTSLTGSDASNYLMPLAFSTSAAITPKLLSVTGTTVANLTQVGSLVASLQMGSLSGLVGTEQLQAAAVGTFDSAVAGSNQAVTVRYSLSNGANGGLANNYRVESQVFWASILAKPGANLGINPVQPRWIPGSSVGGRRVLTVIASVPAALTLPKSDNLDACFAVVSEECQCYPSSLVGVDICFVPLDSVKQISAAQAGS